MLRRIAFLAAWSVLPSAGLTQTVYAQAVLELPLLGQPVATTATAPGHPYARVESRHSTKQAKASTTQAISANQPPSSARSTDVVAVGRPAQRQTPVTTGHPLLSSPSASGASASPVQTTANGTSVSRIETSAVSAPASGTEKQTDPVPRAAAQTATEGTTQRPSGIAKPDQVITITMVGDTGFGGSRQPISARGGRRHGRTIPFSSMGGKIAPYIDGDINFANLETVITSQRGLGAVGKTFAFRTHTAGLTYLIDEMGFNLFSLANNHAVDYGRRGMVDSLEALQAAQPDILGFAGLGKTRDAALAPALFETKGLRFAFAAIGIGANSRGFHPRDGKVGQLPYTEKTTRDIVAGLKGADADYRILSVHAGIERQITPIARDVKRFRDIAAREGGVDLVIGHHAHVTQGIQRVGNSVVFYGLGNFLHPGMQNMAKFDRCRDYGLIAKLHLITTGNGQSEIAAIEALPILDMHVRPRALQRSSAATRIGILNRLARRLDNKAIGASGIRFALKADGTGLHCTPAGSLLPGANGDLCRSWAAHAKAKTAASTKPTPALASTPTDQPHLRKIRLDAGDTATVLQDVKPVAPRIPYYSCSGAVDRSWRRENATARSRATRQRSRPRRARSRRPQRRRTVSGGQSSTNFSQRPAWARAVLGE